MFTTHINGNVTITGRHEGTYTDAEMTDLLRTLRDGQAWIDDDDAAVVINEGRSVWEADGHRFVHYDDELYAIDIDEPEATVYQLSWPVEAD